MNTTDFTNITLEILNQTTSLTQNYTQENDLTICKDEYNFLQIQNATGSYNNVTLLNTTTGNTTQVTLIYKNLQCKPGRYYIPVLTIRNVSYPSVNETANISVIVDIPINTPANYFSNETGVGNFNGQLPINSTYYHSYYFDTSSIENATGIAVNISGWSLPKDLDLFLFDNSSTPLLKGKSIGKSTTSESLFFNYLNYSKPEMWEIRIYGNYSTSTIPYNGNIAFTTLNITNTSDPGQQISSIDFGIMNVTTRVNFTNITLRNEGNISLTNVAKTKEFYHIQRFSGSGTKNFTFLVPDSSIISKVKVVLNWTGGGNYSFNLYNQNNAFLVRSVDRYIYSNFTGAMQEEYNETTNIPSTARFWKVEVKNSTISANPYTLAVHIYPLSTWITTNYSMMTFVNRSYSSNTHINITIPTTALNGSYEGYLQYLDNRNVGIKIPIKVDVTTPMLVVNNTMNSLTYGINENYGVNLTRSFYFNITNLGFYNLSLNFPNSTNLTCTTPTTCSGYNASLSFNTTSVVFSNSWNLTEVNVTFNYPMPVGIYDGWITINGTNDPIINSRPYTNFTINLKLNLTRLLEPRIYSFTLDGDNVVGNGSAMAENVTHKVKVFYINGTTEIEAGNALNTSNFTVWLVERNVSYRIPSTGGLTLYSHTTPLYFGTPSYYNINSTVPANQPGGRYEVHVSTNWTRGDGKNFTGEGINKSTLIINNTGLYMTTNSSTSPSLSNNTNYLFYANVTNYGPLAASSATIKFDRGSCTRYSVAATNNNGMCGCAGSCASDDIFTISPAGHSSSCLVWWTISAGSSSASACTSNIIGSPTNKWFNPYGINVSVTVTGPTEEDGDGISNYTLPTYVAGLAFSEAESLIIVQQNSSNSTIVTVSNTGNVSQNINFTIEDINSTWYTLNSTNASLLVAKFASFLVNFNIGNVEIKEYSGKWKAYSVNKTITSDFTLRVIPSEEEKVEINNTLALYKVNATNLEIEINQSREEGVNVSQTEVKLSELKLKIQEAEDYIAQGDYFSAYQLFREIDLLFIQTRNKLNEAIEEYEEEPKPWFELPKIPSDILVYVGIAVGIVAAIILAYLFWPTPSYRPKKKKYIFKPKEEKIWNQLKQKWAKLSKKKEKK